jgi:hypothetical protein
MHADYSLLVDFLLTGQSCSRELADLLVAGAAPSAEPKAQLFSRPVVQGELESLISAGLDREAAQ